MMKLCSLAQRSAARPHYFKCLTPTHAMVRHMGPSYDHCKSTACSFRQQYDQSLQVSRHQHGLPAVARDEAGTTAAMSAAEDLINAQPSRRRSRRRTATVSSSVDSLSEGEETVQQRRRQADKQHKDIQQLQADKKASSRRRTRRTSRATTSCSEKQDVLASSQHPSGERKLGLGVLLLQQARQSAAVQSQHTAGPISWPASALPPQSVSAPLQPTPTRQFLSTPQPGAQQQQVQTSEQAQEHPNTQWQHNTSWQTNNSVAIHQFRPSAAPYGATPTASSILQNTKRMSHSSDGFADQDDLIWEQQQEDRLLQLVEMLAERGIELPELRVGQQRAQCPQCNNGSQNEDCFAVKVDPDYGSAVWQCHRASCGFKGGLTLPQHLQTYREHMPGRRSRSSSSSNSVPGSSLLHDKALAVALPHPGQLLPLDQTLLQWFKERGISQATLQRNRVAMQMRYCRALGDVVPQIAFPFYQNGVMVNVKYRALPKHFSQVKNGQQVFYGLDDVKGASHVIIVEGEMDKLAIEAATGMPAVLSIPSGAAPYTPQQLQGLVGKQLEPQQRHGHNLSSNSTLSMDKKFAYVHKAADLLSSVKRITIAVDGDAAGFFTACELARRLNPDRCMYLPWPAAVVWGAEALQHVAQIAEQQFGVVVDVAAGRSCKDANDVLMVYGGRFLKLYLENAPTLFTNALEHVKSKAFSVHSTQQHPLQAAPAICNVPQW